LFRRGEHTVIQKACLWIPIAYLRKFQTRKAKNSCCSFSLQRIDETNCLKVLSVGFIYPLAISFLLKTCSVSVLRLSGMMGLKELHYDFCILHRVFRSAPSLFVGAIDQTRCRLTNGFGKLDICSKPAQAIDKRGRIVGGARADADHRLHRHAGGAPGAGARAANIAGGLDLASLGYFFLQGARHDLKIQKVRGIYKSIVGSGKRLRHRIYRADFGVDRFSALSSKEKRRSSLAFGTIIKQK
jgi:hypothetical protein